MNVAKETVVPIKPPKPDTCSCPVCKGYGHHCDGYFIMGSNEIVSRPATPCVLCKGRGKVRVQYSPLEDGE